MKDNSIWADTQKIVMSLGISVSCKGFYYLIYAVVFSLELGLQKVSLEKDVYERIACINKVSVYSVEKCIRNSIIKAWNDNGGYFRKAYGYSPKKPTNSEVIAFISNCIRLERRIDI